MKTATISFNPSIKKFQAIYNGQVIVQGNNQSYVSEMITSGLNKKAKKLGITKVSIGNLHYSEIPTSEEEVEKIEEFTINERFQFVSDTVQMVLDKDIPSTVITGNPGLGKTFTVIKQMKTNGLQNVRDFSEPEVIDEVDEDGNPIEATPWTNPGDFIFVKGFSTARGMFRTLWENNGKIVIFDDCDSVLKDPNAVNILKSALDSYDERWVTWNSENRSSDLPKSFLFTGQVIFISNLSPDQLDIAIKSRSICIDVTMTTNQKIQRMQEIITSPDFYPAYPIQAKQDALDLIAEHKERVTDLSLRTLISITKIRVGKSKDWTKMAKYILTNN